MEEHVVKVVSIEQVTHDVKRFRVEKPEGYTFVPGQATEVSIHEPELVKEKRPFTFTCLPADPYLEFTIKIYESHHGVTHVLNQLKPGAELVIRDVWGAISYKGKGTFIAGGAGVTPFISIFRHLQSIHKVAGNKLIFANKTKADIILEPEFTTLLGKGFVNILSEEKVGGYFYGKIDEEFLKSNIVDFDKKVYVCGPPSMMEAVMKQLSNIGMEDSAITVEI
jgi:ferredoxin-NADP reductase